MNKKLTKSQLKARSKRRAEKKNKKDTPKVWSKKDYAKYYKESNALSDYSCPKHGIIE